MKIIIKCNKEQAQLIQTALDFYSRVGILQLGELLSHPTIENFLRERFRPQKELEVGDDTERGKITKITKKYIWTEGSWGKGKEVRRWDNNGEVKLSIDYGAYHEKEDEIKELLTEINSIIYGKSMSRNMSLGIYNNQVHESCREAFNMIQVIRNFFWRQNPNRSEYTVDAAVDTWIKNKIEIENYGEE